MSNVRGELEVALKQVDQSPSSITGCTSMFVKFYANAPEHAARVWFDAMMADSAPAGHLPLVYVCHDALRETYRIGKNYHEHFSPYLKQALGHAIWKSDENTVNKIRNLVKLWGDSRFYSQNYITRYHNPPSGDL